ncbi:uncharacterized protein LOC114405603 [Glycine soja]|uniref:uncharacterized mitochondrial protein AtMg00810-like n=1 Tax=Glycine max TaxID=3847 RepID=UPI0003DEA1C4|nr:uncharacterized mitochondrial protein AtMg00810-like [Glycine max]XP_028223860.1 uncharacterized protein LOC114405603 [Glycine soja]|eukprot:XP_006577375.1 uncharacterized protein LOC102662121 [Glycine max]
MAFYKTKSICSSLQVLTFPTNLLSANFTKPSMVLNKPLGLGNNLASLQQLVTKFHHAFSLTDLSVLDYVLGVEVKQQHDGSIILTKAKYIWDLLSKKNMSEAKPISSLMYASITRPKISFSLNKVYQFMSHPLKTHWVAVKRILWYLKGTISWGLHLKPPFAPIFITTFCDANWAFDPDDRRLNFGACVFFGPNLISW